MRQSRDLPRSTGAEQEPEVLRIRLRKLVALSCLLSVVLTVGCGPTSEIREYTVPTEEKRVITSEAIRNEFPAIPFEWNIPESWAGAENDQFSKMAWTAGPIEDTARITLSDLPISAGLVPQLTRWRRQIQANLDSNADPMEGTKPLKLDGGNATSVDFEGAEATILGLLVPSGDKLWIFKFRGSTPVADEHRETFRTFCESVKVR